MLADTEDWPVHLCETHYEQLKQEFREVIA